MDLLTPIEVAASRGDIAIGVFIWEVLPFFPREDPVKS